MYCGYGANNFNGAIHKISSYAANDSWLHNGSYTTYVTMGVNASLSSNCYGNYTEVNPLYHSALMLVKY